MIKSFADLVHTAAHRVLESVIDDEDRDRIAQSMCHTFEEIAAEQAKGSVPSYPVPMPDCNGLHSHEQLLAHRQEFAQAHLRWAMSVVKSNWELEKVIPDGWAFYSANFALHASGIKQEGKAQLLHQESGALTVGHGATIREAILNAAANIRKS